MAIMSRVTLLVRKYKRSFDLLISSCDNLSYFSLVGGGGGRIPYLVQKIKPVFINSRSRLNPFKAKATGQQA